MPKKKTPDENPKDQFKRFLEVAREKGVDDATAKDAFKALSRSPPENRRAQSGRGAKSPKTDRS